jgi:hypothetical protein
MEAMPDPTITRALEVAAQELEGSAAASQWLAEPEELAAAAIAAFHKNMAARLIEPWASWHRDMAAAVRRAAGGGE